MAKKRKVWTKPAGKKPTSSLTDSLKAEVESKAADLIENVLKPKHIQPPPENQQFNYITDIGTKWYRNNFYFVSTYACPGPHAIFPTFKKDLPEWNMLVMANLPCLSCGTPESGSGFMMLSRSMSA